MHDVLDDTLVASAAQLAARWQRRAEQLLTSQERSQQAQLAQMLNTPMDKVILVKLLDQSLRSKDPARVADQINYLLETNGSPQFFSTDERFMSFLFRQVGRHLPGLTVPKIIANMRKQSEHLVIPGEPQTLSAHLSKRKEQGVQVNINHLGEAVLGEAEAQRRLSDYLADLANPLVEHISVKISTLYSQLHPLAHDHDVTILAQRLGTLYEAAQNHYFERNDGSRAPKIVHLDMEAYQDLNATVAAFKKTLEQDRFQTATAGIVLQAYLPESYGIQQSLTQWAQRRTAAGGAPIRLRIVKGANLEMERVAAALSGWPLAPYDNKPDVDANFKRMLLYGLTPDHIESVHIGVASHNLFELALAYRVAKVNGVENKIVFEMLEGMADHVRRALAEQGLTILLYAPVARESEFLHAIAYLIRRMDENTSPGNYLRHAPKLKSEGKTWQRLASDFKLACRRMNRLAMNSHRVQNRQKETASIDEGTLATGRFSNEPDTDWSLPANREWARTIRETWKKGAGDQPVEISPIVAGQTISEGTVHEVIDINQLPDRVVVARYCQATPDVIGRAVEVARQDPDGWRGQTLDQRHEALTRAAANLRRARGSVIGAAAAETGKIFSQSDPEVSEAIDFAEYYPHSMTTFSKRVNLRINAKGVGVVVSPWNFPIAIACGGVTAALAAGNTVILKPASNAVVTAWQLCQCFWQAGISQNTLQFLPCDGAMAGEHLIGHPQVDFVILTGGTETAHTMLRRKPDLFLCAETGGKNSTIVTAMADRDQAIGHVMASAFGHCGQKCSATSLLILEKEVFNDPQFKRTLVDAARSLAVGPAWQFENRMGPLIRPPSGALLRGLTRLEPGESWALIPENTGDNPHLWTPGIKWNVQPGSFTHLTELFGPVLGVMRADDLEHAVDLANQTGYGLTAGLESLDPREATQWKKSIQAGNLYINRVTTGAITRRQPFGGWNKSAVGPAIKAGGPNYVTQFVDIEETGPPPEGCIEAEGPLLVLAQHWEAKCRWGQMDTFKGDVTRTIQAIYSYLHHARTDFETPCDPFHLRGEDNLLSHRPVDSMAVCVHPDDTLFEVAARIAAGRIAGCNLLLSLPDQLDNAVTTFLDGQEGRRLTRTVKVVRNTTEDVAALTKQVDRLRYASPDRVPAQVYEAAARTGIYIARAPVAMDGRIELIHYYLGQTLSHAYHRAGNLGARGLVIGEE